MDLIIYVYMNIKITGKFLCALHLKFGSPKNRWNLHQNICKKYHLDWIISTPEFNNVDNVFVKLEILIRMIKGPKIGTFNRRLSNLNRPLSVASHFLKKKKPNPQAMTIKYQ